MRIKQFVKVLSSAILLASISNAFATNMPCPTNEQVREVGSKFSYAYNQSGVVWVLLSEPFSLDGSCDWQTAVTLSIPGAGSPAAAIEVGKLIFSQSPLLTTPSTKIVGDKTECSYAPKNANYSVITTSPVNYGIKKAK